MQQTNALTAAHILLVEDDDDLAELMQLHLKFQGHTVTRKEHLKHAIASYEKEKFDLLVLDRGLPDGDGIDICHYLRDRNDWTPVLMLTARDSEIDKVDGLEAGVDDYITKPFSVLEFQARVRNVLRRIQSRDLAKVKPTSDSQLLFGTLSIDPTHHHVALDNQSVHLTANEFALLHFMAKRPGRVYSKDELLSHVWQTDHSGYHHTVCSTVNRLRNKLKSSTIEHHYIQTVWGVGYKFQPA